MRGEGYELHKLSPVLDELLQIVDASYTANGEIQMDYTRFRQCLRESKAGLDRLGIYLPSLNEGGSGAVFHTALRRVAACARIGDYAGAKRATGVYRTTTPPPTTNFKPAKPRRTSTREIPRSAYQSVAHKPSWCQVLLGEYLQNLTGRLVVVGVIAALIWLAVQCAG